MSKLIAALTDHYYQPQEKGQEKIAYLSPTRLLKCYRGAFMESLGYKEPLSWQMSQYFDYGTVRHDAIQDLLLDRGVIKRNPNPDKGKHPAEWRVESEDPPLFGYADGIFSDDSAILEIKTTGKLPDKITSPFPDHVSQATLYMHVTGIHKAHILYESKSLPHGSPLPPWKEFVVEYKKERAEKVLRRVSYLLSALESRKLPFPESKCWNCTNPACWDTEIHRKEGLK